MLLGPASIAPQGSLPIALPPRRHHAEALCARRLGPQPSDQDRWTCSHSHDWFTLDWNAQRLAVLDRHTEAITRTHARIEAAAGQPPS